MTNERDRLKVQDRFESFRRGFLHPVLEGGAVTVGRPLTPGMLAGFSRSRPIDDLVDRAIITALQRHAAEVAPLGRVLWQATGLMPIAMACHNLLSVTDPRFLRWGSRGGQRVVLRWIDGFLQQAGAPTTRSEVLLRHAFTTRFLDARREDVTASNWAYTHRYVGRPMPDGFFSKPRWVQLRRRQRDLFELFVPPSGNTTPTSPMGPLLSRTPLTQLLRSDTVSGFEFTGAILAVLSDPSLRSGAARGLVARGRSIMAPLGRGLRQLEASPAIFLRYAISLVFEMHLIATLDARTHLDPVFAKPANEDEAFFCAVLPATLAASMAQRPLPNSYALLNSRDGETVKRWSTTLARVSGNHVVDAAVSLTQKATSVSIGASVREPA